MCEAPPSMKTIRHDLARARIGFAPEAAARRARSVGRVSPTGNSAPNRSISRREAGSHSCSGDMKGSMRESPETSRAVKRRPAVGRFDGVETRAEREETHAERTRTKTRADRAVQPAERLDYGCPVAPMIGVTRSDSNFATHAVSRSERDGITGTR